MESLFVKSLAEAEAKGLFQRLVLLHEVGWNTPWYKTKQPPRLKQNKEGYFEPC